MQDSPSAELLIAQVRQELEQGLAPGFAQKVAANALGIALREFTLAPESTVTEFDRLEALVGHEGDLQERNRRLAEGIRAGGYVTHTTGLVAHLIRTTLEKLEVDQPNYPAYTAWKDSI